MELNYIEPSGVGFDPIISQLNKQPGIDAFESLAAEIENWLRETFGPFIARSQAEKATFGTLKPSTLANLDIQGVGPANRKYVGRATVYSTRDFAQWLAQRFIHSKTSAMGRGV